MSHTPGPWELHELETNHHGYNWPTFTVRSARNHCLAVVGDVDRATSGNNTANARLIAAAPGMYDALQAIANMQITENTDKEALLALCIAIAKIQLAKLEGK